ncbi:XRE family transcriptional regulator [Micromonospora sp. NPDC049523]|uniref:XRE family transcriptional regulator n=1 Tax=Micromonospora sp. NPDC049523 TaxID=3155921 RepID=UPI003433808B
MLYGHRSAHSGFDANYVGKLERGEIRWPQEEYRKALRVVLNVRDDVDLGFCAAKARSGHAPGESVNVGGREKGAVARQTPGAHVLQHRGLVPQSGPRSKDSFQFGDPLAPAPVSLLAPGRGPAATAPLRQPFTLWAPEGRFFPGLALEAYVHPAVIRGQIMVTVPDGYGDDPILNRPGRALVVGSTESRDGNRLFGMDSRHVRRRLRGAMPGARLAIPHAYVLDELTSAVLWAVTNLDAALLADDDLLEESRRDLPGYEPMVRSAASRDLAADLTPAAQIWLGSAFCAGHIRRHYPTLTDVPVFWTQESNGEEASTWLLFGHKLEYLRATAERFIGAGPVRIFCVPRSALDGSPTGERILLLLAVALMESYGIRVIVTDEPEYAGTAGFVSDRRRAIVATWVRADGIWHVDVTNNRSTLREYTDAANEAMNHSVIAGLASPQRLRALADYLGLDWLPLARRCRELADHGLAGIAQPRSRHLSMAGIDRSCRYVAGIDLDAY